MNKILKNLFFIFFIIFLTINSLKADEIPTRWIDLEWDDIPEAKGYDIELFELLDGKEYSRGIFHSDKSHWSKETKAGKYSVKIRALDKRKVPGPWGEAMPISVKLIPPTLLKPSNDEIFSTSEMDDLVILFHWNISQGSKLYQIVVFNEKNEVIVNEVITNNDYQKRISQIDNYKWFVMPLYSDDEKLPPAEILSKNNNSIIMKKFSVKGKQLIAPIINLEYSAKKGVIFRWEEIYRAEKYKYELYKEDENNDIKKIANGETTKKILGVGKQILSNGKFVFAVRAQATKFQESELARVTFILDNEQIEIINNESINKEFMNRGIDAASVRANFGYPGIKYTSKNYENDTTSTETLRGLAVYAEWKKPIFKKAYFNLLSFKLSQVADTYSEGLFYHIADQIGKSFSFTHSRLFLSAGLRFEFTPLIYADRFSTKISNLSYQAVGPDINTAYNYRLGPNWSANLNAKIFLPLMSIKAPPGNKLKSSFSIDTELKIFYSLNPQIDFYAGFSRIDHKIRSDALINDISLAIPGDVNEISFSSTYSLFGLEFYY
jgi:hypothetical protein